MAGFRSLRISWATVFSKRCRGEPFVLDSSLSYSMMPSISPCQGAMVMPCPPAAAGHPSAMPARSRPADLDVHTSSGDVTAGASGEADPPGGAPVVAGPAGLPGRHRVVGDRLRRRLDRGRVAGVTRVADPVDPVRE